HMREMAKDMAPHFGGDLAASMQYVQDIMRTGRSDLKAQLSMEQQIKIQDVADRLAAKYPTAPMNMIYGYANLQATGNPGAPKLLKYISEQFKREGTISGEQFDRTDKYHYAELNQAAWIHRETMNLQAQKAIIDAAGEEGKVA